MTEEKGNGSRLKGALGLDNLKGLGETLKQIKELKMTLDEAQGTLTELAQGNSPMARALAQLIEAEGIKALNKDNVNILQEVREKMEKELGEKDETIENLESENKDLKEDKAVREVTAAVTAELDRRLPPGGNRGSEGGESKLTKAIENAVADYLEKRLLPGGETGLTSEQIRNIVKEEIAPVVSGNNKPEDLVDSIVNAFTMGDKLREKLGMVGIGGRFLPPDGGGSNLRGDLIKILLEDEREKLKIEHEHEAKTETNKQWGILVGAIKENAGDIAAGFRVAAEEVKRTQGAAKEQPPQQFKCGDCQTQFSAPQGWAGQNLKCPNPSCGREYTQEELLE